MSRRPTRSALAHRAARGLLDVGIPVARYVSPSSQSTMYAVHQRDVDAYVRGVGPLDRWVVRELGGQPPQSAPAPASRWRAAGAPR